MRLNRSCIPAFLFFIALALGKRMPAQENNPDRFTDISKVIVETRILDKVSSAYSSSGQPAEQLLPSLKFIPGIQHKGPTMPEQLLSKRIFLQFAIHNTADSLIQVYFCPGYYFNDIRLFRKDKSGFTALPEIMPDINEKRGFRQLSLAAGDSMTIIAEIKALKTYNNILRPRLVGGPHINAFLAQLHSNFKNGNQLTYVFCGLLLMMILFSITNYIQGGNKEFLYYSGYALFLGGLFFLQSIYQLHASGFGFFLEGYLDFILQGTGTIFYMLFMKKFLDTRNKHPFLLRLYNTGIAILIGAMILYTLLHYFSANYQVEYLTEFLSKVLLLILILIFMVYSLRKWDNHLLRYLFWGNLFLFVFSSLSYLGIVFNHYFRQLPGLLNSTVTYYETGLFLELTLFLAGLNYKNRRNIIRQTKERETLKAQNLLKEYEKEIAVYKAQQEERQRISADMHDELGAGMTAIRLMSEIARNKMKENTPVEIEKISRSADDVLNKMNAIIWSMNSGNDTLDNLVSYIRSYAIEYFDGTQVDCRVQVSEQLPAKELTGDKRRNIFLSVKESLNNILKHAEATAVVIRINTDEGLEIIISDNGKGIDLDKLRQFGNGLKNIARRMESIGGRYHIENKNGTVSTLSLPL